MKIILTKTKIVLLSLFGILSTLNGYVDAEPNSGNPANITLEIDQDE